MREEFTLVWVNGQNVAERDSVVSAIADRLKAAANPLIVVDAIDLAGAAEIVELARSANAVLDHSAASNIAFLQEQGWLGTTPGEAGIRADAVLLVGPLSDSIATDEAFRRLCNEHPTRTFRYIGSEPPPSAIASLVSKGLAGSDVGQISLTALLGAVRAHVAGHALDHANAAAIGQLGDWMTGAKYGVAVFATGALDDLEGHALSGLLDDLSLKTRWNALPLAVPAGQNELIRMSSSLTGLPVPATLNNRQADHDRWRYSARQVIERGEADCVLWISSSTTALPDWLTGGPELIVVSAHDQSVSNARVQAKIGIAGVDYPAIIEPAELGAFAAITTPDGSSDGSAACIIGAIRKRLETNGAAV